MSACVKCKKEIDIIFRFCPFCGHDQRKKTRKRRMLKRENGTGSVYKRSDLKKRPWVAATPATDKEPAQIIGYYETAQDAKDALDDYRRHPTTKLNMTLREVYEEWQPIWVRGKSKQLVDSYNAAFAKLYPLYDWKFRELRTGNFQSIVNGFQEYHPKLDKQKKPVFKDEQPIMLPPASYSSLHDVKVLAGLLYGYAMQNDIVNKDYAEYIILPEKGASPKERFTDLEVEKIEKAATTGVPYADCIYMMCYLGFRISEFLHLTKFNVHFAGNIMLLVGGNKTDAGKDRPVPVHPKIRPYVETWLAKGGDTIICREDGHPFSAKYFRENCYYLALEQIGVRHLAPHATRRTFSTRASAAGMRKEDIIAIMGHADFSVDIDSYINQEAKTLQKAIELVP